MDQIAPREAWQPLGPELEGRLMLPCRGDRTCLALRGTVDLSAADPLHTALDELRATGGVQLHVDLARVDLIDAAGVRVFALTARDLEAQRGRLHLHNPAPIVVRVLDIAGLGRLLVAPRCEGACGTCDSHAHA